jgi:hypothetical protein
MFHQQHFVNGNKLYQKNFIGGGIMRNTPYYWLVLLGEKEYHILPILFVPSQSHVDNILETIYKNKLIDFEVKKVMFSDNFEAVKRVTERYLN